MRLRQSDRRRLSCTDLEYVTLAGPDSIPIRAILFGVGRLRPGVRKRATAKFNDFDHEILE